MTYPTPEATYTLPPAGGVSLQFVQTQVTGWLDQTNTAGGAGGTPVPACQGAPLPVQIIGGGGASGTVAQGAAGSAAWPVADSNSAAYQGVVTITPGTATTPLRGLAFLCTAGGNITLTLADSSTMTFPIAASSNLQVLGFAVSNVALGTGTAGTFWGCK